MCEFPFKESQGVLQNAIYVVLRYTFGTLRAKGSKGVLVDWIKGFVNGVSNGCLRKEEVAWTVVNKKAEGNRLPCGTIPRQTIILPIS